MHDHLQAPELRALARTAARSGKIPEELVRYFDRDGKWVGDRLAWPTTTIRSLAQIMRGIVLPPRRRSHSENGRRILLTSLCWSGKDILVADWHEIRGNVFIGPHSGFVNPCLDKICGSLTGASADKVSLPQLCSVGGHYGFKSMARFVEISWLRHVGGNMHVRGWNPLNLETVGGSLKIESVLHVHLPKLRQVGGSVLADDGEDFQAPCLEVIGGDFDTGFSAKSVSLPQLRKVGGSFTAIMAVRIDAPRLREVGGHAFTHSAPDFAPWGLRVGCTWRMHDQAKAFLERCQRARELLRGGEDFYL